MAYQSASVTGSMTPLAKKGKAETPLVSASVLLSFGSTSPRHEGSAAHWSSSQSIRPSPSSSRPSSQIDSEMSSETSSW